MLHAELHDAHGGEALVADPYAALLVAHVAERQIVDVLSEYRTHFLWRRPPHGLQVQSLDVAPVDLVQRVRLEPEIWVHNVGILVYKGDLAFFIKHLNNV